ncbi:diphthine--ammonia ligase [Caldivirga sp.]|uniref:diphthine--ammonia ligase n=1 Tax=Caldivirga sp. TaxID=2080243 RepID=UPI0025C11FF6|nr:diphthine--ammonia ligase [Caldivirga sp.]
MRPVCVLFSGGKDSTYAVHWALMHGFDVKCLVTLMPGREDSWMFHRPAVEYTRLQAEAMGIRQIIDTTSGVRGEELDDLRRILKRAIDECEVTGVVTGALLSDYQRMNINMVSEELKIRVYSPLWRKNQARYLMELHESGLRFMLTSIDAYGLDSRLLGKVLDKADLEYIIELSQKYGFNPAFEGGEAETFVVDAPLFRKSIKVSGYVKRIGEYSWRFIITDASFKDK